MNELLVINDRTPGGYMGASWIRDALRVEYFSQLGIEVADFLGDLFKGIYHLDVDKLSAVEWGNNHHIEFALGWRSMSTVDDSLLTQLVILAHDRSIRVEISPRANNYLTLLFHKRKRHGDLYEIHPTIESAIELIRSHFHSGDKK